QASLAQFLCYGLELQRISLLRVALEVGHVVQVLGVRIGEHSLRDAVVQLDRSTEGARELNRLVDSGKCSCGRCFHGNENFADRAHDESPLDYGRAWLKALRTGGFGLPVHRAPTRPCRPLLHARTTSALAP